MSKQRKNKQRHVWFVEDIYLSIFHIYVGGTQRQAYRRWLKDTGQPPEAPLSEADPEGSTFTHPTYKRMGIYLKRFNGSAEDIGTLVHEALHATNIVLNGSNVDAQTRSTDEPYAYYIDWLVKTTIRKLGFNRAK